MRTLFGTILCWAGLATLAAITALIGLAAWNFGPPGHDEFLRQTMDRLIVEAVGAHRRGGPSGLAESLGALDRFYPGEHHLLDESGRDLVTGLDRSAWLRRPGPPLLLADGRLAMAFPSRDGAHQMVALMRREWSVLSLWPYALIVVLAIAGLSAGLAQHLARPIGRLRVTMDSFGQGELDARCRSKRRDEVGELSRAFDGMADRVATLLAAERRLLQDVSHELRSPLARLGLALALAREGNEAARSHALDRAQREVDRLAVLMDELMQLTRAEGDPNAMRRAPVDLQALLAPIADDARLEGRERGVLVVQKGERRTVQGDGDLLRRAIENVARNAVRYAPSGSAIDLIVVDAPEGDQVCVQVRDRGPGAPESALEAIFAPFYRVETDRSRTSGGTGLGLAIARRAVAVHGGTIVARNARPGLLVEVRLPIEGGARPTGEGK